jgi:hypothetical protein
MLNRSIDRNRARWARYTRARNVLNAVTLGWWEYHREGKEEKARRVMARCMRVLSPLAKSESSRRGRMRLG